MPTRIGPLPRRRVLAALLAAAVLPLSAASAHPPPMRPSSQAYSVTLEDSAGSALPTYWHRGERFVLGQYGERYAVRIANHSGRRVEAVLSVDGRDAVSGRPGDYAGQRGYLIEPYGSIVVTGFRRSFDEVATFRFTSPEDSYSARMGTPENVGVIGVAFFPEAERYRHRPLPLAEERRSSAPRKNPNPRAGEARKPKAASRSATEAPSGAPAPASRDRESRSRRHAYAESESYGERDNLGTSYGESRESRVTEVPFERQDRRHPAWMVKLRYDDVAGLRARGIHVDPEPRPYWWPERDPQPFPDSRFAPPPP